MFNKKALLPIFALSTTFLASCGSIGKDTAVEGKLAYETSGSTITVTGITNGIEKVTDITVPEKIDGKKVTKIKEGAFSGASKLKSLSLPFIGSTSELNTNNTKEGVLGYIFGSKQYDNAKKVSQIYDCKWNESKWRYDNVVADYYIPTSLKSVTITTAQSEIPFGAFCNCDFINTIDISKTNAIDIYSYSFAYCDKLNNIVLPENLETIGDAAFYYCESLKDITFPETLWSVGEYSFSHCYSLHDVVFSNPETVYVGAEAFENCNSRLNYLRQDYVNDLPVFYFVGDYIDYYYDHEDEEYVVDDLSDEYLFTPCVDNLGLKRDLNDGYNMHYCVVTGYEGTKGTTKDGLEYAISNRDKKSNEKSAVITRYVGKDTADVSIPADIENVKVTTLGDFAFFKAKNINKLNITSDNLDYIGGYVISESNIKELKFVPSSTDPYIHYRAFNYSNLDALTIPSEITSTNFSYENFEDYDILTGNSSVNYKTINFESGSKYNPDVNDDTFLPDYNNGIEAINFLGTSELTSDGLSNLLKNVYRTKLNTLNLGNKSKVTEIDNYKLSSVYKTFTTMVLGEDSELETIGSYAFGVNDDVFESGANAPQLQSIDLENATKLSCIKANAFSNCVNLGKKWGELNLPASLFTEEADGLAISAFHGFQNTQKITIESSKYNVEERFRFKFDDTTEYPVQFSETEEEGVYQVKDATIQSSTLKPVFDNALIKFTEEDPDLYTFGIAAPGKDVTGVNGRGDTHFNPGYAFNIKLSGNDVGDVTSTTQIALYQDDAGGTPKAIEAGDDTWSYDSTNHIISIKANVLKAKNLAVTIAIN